MARGIVYCLENPAMPGYVKIGMTNNIERRMGDLYSTSVPLPFECLLALEVEDAAKTEDLLHEVFAAQRVVRNREFFQVDREAVMAAMLLTGGVDVTPDAIDTGDAPDVRQAAAQRRPFFRFDDAGIPLGSVLTYRDDESVTVVVRRLAGLHRSVQLGGEDMSLGAAARRVREQRGEQPLAQGGPWMWRYKGERLDERRSRMEREGTYGGYSVGIPALEGDAMGFEMRERDLKIAEADAHLDRMAAMEDATSRAIEG